MCDALQRDAARARRLAFGLNDPTSIRTLAEYAAELDRRLDEIQRQQSDDEPVL